MQTHKEVSVSTLLTSANILLTDDPGTKTDLIKKLVRAACKDLNTVDLNDIEAQVLHREEGISTTLDTGLSIPHSRVAEIEDFRAAMAVIPHGLKDQENPDINIKVMFLFLSPANPAFFQRHLQILADLSELFKESFINKLSNAKNAEELLSLIQNAK